MSDVREGMTVEEVNAVMQAKDAARRQALADRVASEQKVVDDRFAALESRIAKLEALAVAGVKSP